MQIFFKCQNYNDKVDCNISQWCVLLILFKYKGTFISLQRHSNIAAYNYYFISLKISLSYGGEKSKVPLAVRRLGHGFFGPFFEHQSLADTGGSVPALHISHWLPPALNTSAQDMFMHYQSQRAPVWWQ